MERSTPPSQPYSILLRRAQEGREHRRAAVFDSVAAELPSRNPTQIQARASVKTAEGTQRGGGRSMLAQEQGGQQHDSLFPTLRSS